MNKSHICVSVIIPIFNMEQYLGNCLDSVVSQSLQEIEIICINDGSTDRSLDIINKYAARDSRIVLIDQKNQGVAAARNAGMNYASGEYICFMDPDDWYPEADILHYLYDKAIEQNVNICGGSFSEYLPDGTIVTEFTGNKRKYQFHKDGLIFYEDYQFDFGYHRFIYNNKFLKQNRIFFPLYARFQDPPFFVNAMITARKFYAVSKITYAYRVGNFKNIKWTEQKLSDLLKGLTDNLKYSEKHQLAELHMLTVRRMAVNYRKLFTQMASAPCTENFINLLIQADQFINEDLLSADDINKNYHNVVIDILKDSGFEEPELMRLSKTPQTNDQPLFSIPKPRSGIISQSCQDIKVSVIIPVYNVEEFLTECIETVIDQSLKDIEIICVNDGSTDNSRKIVELFMEVDKRIVLVDKKNGGLSSARNAGLKNARGKYIYFLDSDDYLEQNALKILYEAAEKENLDVIDFDAIPLFESEESADRYKHYMVYYERNATYKEVTTGETFLTKTIQNNDFKPAAWLHFIKKDFLDKIGVTFYEGIIHEDNLFTIQLLIWASRLKYLDQKFYYRRLRDGSIMTVPQSTKNVYGYFITLTELFQLINSVELQSETVEAIKSRMQIHERTIFDIYRRVEDKNMDSYWNGNQEKELLFNIIIKEPYRLISRETEKRTELQRQKEKLKEESDQLKRELECLKKDNKHLQKEKKNIQDKYDCVWNSMSLRIGRIITCVPRKTRTFFKYWKNNGSHKALQLVKEKLGL